jgi:uncharacterized SAM-binding protein YcdF (DUF218 family)
MELGVTFLLKKIVAWILMPMPLGILIFVIALWALYTHKVIRAKRFLIAGLVWFGIMSHSYVGSLFLLPLESQYTKLEKVPQGVKYILLLGGDKEKRAWEAVRLYQLVDGVKIITSGYSMHDKISDAQKTAELLEEAGVPSQDILMQEQVKDTKEEAMRMKQRVGGQPFLLVTSAYHMPRAMMLFKKEGLHPIAAPCDFNDRGEGSLWALGTAKQLEKTEKAWHEYIGLAWTYLRGQI